MQVVMIANDTTFIYNLRKEIIEQLMHENHTVTLICQRLLFCTELEKLGCRIIDVHTGRREKKPISDIKLFFQYYHYLKRLKPDIVLSNNIKPNVYAGIACSILKIKYMPNITGLGTALEFPGVMQVLTRSLYRIGMRKAECIYFQNKENMLFFEKNRIRNVNSKSVLLPGSGVNLSTHAVREYVYSDPIHYLFVARIMEEKGIDLFLSAAKYIHNKYVNTRFHVCGMCEDEKYIRVLLDAEQEGYIKYYGEQSDMIPFYQMAHCVVHPSYYPEGMSNVLLEAAASGRPVIAADRSGCRETVEDGKTGFLIPVKDEQALIKAMEKFLNLSWSEREKMGLAGRSKMEKEFDRRNVVKMVMNEVQNSN